MPNCCAILAVIFLCHAQASEGRPSDLDTSFFDTDSNYDYDNEPYFVSKNVKSQVKDPWTLDFRNKLAENEAIGKTFSTASPLLWSIFATAKVC